MAILIGTANDDTLTGGDGDDVLEGVGGNDTLNGGAGSDTLAGGTGNDVLDGGDGSSDRASYVGSATGVAVSLLITGAQDTNEGLDTLVNIEDLEGSAFDDGLVGNDGTNQILGGEGNDQLYGEGGNDILRGGAGADGLRGGTGNDSLWGDAGDDWLEGEEGADTLVGGSGNDTYVIAATATMTGDGGYSFSDIDQVAEDLNGGTDTVISNASYTLGTNVENLQLVGDLDVSGFGNALDNEIIGNEGDNFLQGQDGDDYLDGGAGADHLIGGTGNDTYVIDSQFDVIGPESPEESAGIDTVVSSIDYALDYALENLVLTAGASSGTGNQRDNLLTGNAGANLLNGVGGNDTIFGGAGADTLRGDFGDDVLTGGSGVDTLSGGAGSDTFRDTIAGLSGDTITDLGVGDRIILSDATLAGFTFDLTGTTLSFTGGSLTLSDGLNGTLTASAAIGGGVQLTVEPPVRDIANDFNGDGRSDVLWRNDNGPVTDWIGAENGGFTFNNGNFVAGVGAEWSVVGTGDFDGDHRDDILWRNTNGTLTNWLGAENGGFTFNNGNFVAGVGAEWSVVGIADFDGDQKDDILWRNADGTLTNWLGAANGGFTPNNDNFVAGVSNNWSVIATGDFDGDGKADILWRDTFGTVADWLGQANGGFTINSGNFIGGMSANWTVAGTADFNGDTRTDVLWRNDNGLFAFWYGQANGGFTSATWNSGVGTEWDVAQIGDFNGDGHEDILWRNADGVVTDWLGGAFGAFSPNAGTFVVGVSNDWHIQPPELV